MCVISVTSYILVIFGSYLQGVVGKSKFGKWNLMIAGRQCRKQGLEEEGTGEEGLEQ